MELLFVEGFRRLTRLRLVVLLLSPLIFLKLTDTVTKRLEFCRQLGESLRNILIEAIEVLLQLVILVYYIADIYINFLFQLLNTTLIVAKPL